jgi:hypothetical protein
VSGLNPNPIQATTPPGKEACAIRERRNTPEGTIVGEGQLWRDIPRIERSYSQPDVEGIRRHRLHAGGKLLARLEPSHPRVLPSQCVELHDDVVWVGNLLAIEEHACRDPQQAGCVIRSGLAIKKDDDVRTNAVLPGPDPVGSMTGVSAARKRKPVDDVASEPILFQLAGGRRRRILRLLS